MQTFKVNGQLVTKTEWEQTDAQMDGCECITSLANAVGNKTLCKLPALALHILKWHKFGTVWYNICTGMTTVKDRH